MSPLQIEVLFWYYAKGGDHPMVFDNPPVWPGIRDEFLMTGLLVSETKNHSRTYELGERGSDG